MALQLIVPKLPRQLYRCNAQHIRHGRRDCAVDVEVLHGFSDWIPSTSVVRVWLTESKNHFLFCVGNDLSVPILVDPISAIITCP